MDIEGAPKRYLAALYISLLEAAQLPGAYASEDGEAVGMDVPIRYLLTPVYGVLGGTI